MSVDTATSNGTGTSTVMVGVLALQGAFVEHLRLLKLAALDLGANQSSSPPTIHVLQVRSTSELAQCDALILPGGESTSMSLIAERTGLLEPLRAFVAAQKPMWGTCAGMILLAAEATTPDGEDGGTAVAVSESKRQNPTAAPGSALIGGLDVRVRRNHFGRQTDSFEADLVLPFLDTSTKESAIAPFHAVFIRAPVVSAVLEPSSRGADMEEVEEEGEVEVLARLPPRARSLRNPSATAEQLGDAGAIVAVRQRNVFATAFHPELTGDVRLHAWWLRQVLSAMGMA